MPSLASYSMAKPKKIPLLIYLPELEKVTKTWYKKKEFIGNVK